MRPRDPEPDRKIRLLRQHARSASDRVRHPERTVVFKECQEVGFKYRDRHPGHCQRRSPPHSEAARDTVAVLPLFDARTADGRPCVAEGAARLSV